MRLVASLAVALRYLTIVPVPGGAPDGPGALARAASWFPPVGFGIGLVAVAAERATSALFPPLLSALLTVTVWKLLSGGLHLDGLADCLDGLAGRDPAHRLAIMRDSQIGAFGALGLILFLLFEIVAVSELPVAARWRALLIAPVIARATPALLVRLFPAARAAGHGAAFGASAPAALAALGLGVAAAGGVAGTAGLLAAGVALLVALGVAWFMASRLGGITGGVLGAAIEAAEMAALLTVFAWAHVRR